MTTPKTTFREEIRGLSRPIWVLAGGVFVDRFGLFVIPFLILFLTSQGISKEMASLAAGLFGVGGLCGGAIGGFLTDRIGRRNTMGVSMFGSAAGGLMIFFSAQVAGETGVLWPLFLSVVGYGTTRSFYHTASSSLVADLVPPESRVAAFAVIRFAINLGFAMGMACAGFLAKISFGWLFAIDATTSCIFGALSVLMLPPGERTEKSQSGWRVALPVILRDRNFLLIGLNTIVVASIYLQWHSTFALHLKDLGYAASMFGLLMSWNGLLIILLEMPLSSIARRFSAPKVIALGSVLSAVGFALSGWATGVFGWAIAIFIFTIGEMLTMPVQGAYVSDLAPKAMRGRYNGAMGVTWSSSHIIAPMLGVYLLGFGYPYVCVVALVATIVTAGLLTLGASDAGRSGD